MTSPSAQTGATARAEFEQKTDETDVVEYLQRNPDFFLRNQQLLEETLIPHQSGNAVSLVERQIMALRDKNQRLQTRLDTLIEVSHQNNEIQQQFHDLVLEVLASHSINDALTCLKTRLTNDLSVDHTQVRLLSDRQHPLSGINETFLMQCESVRETLDSFIPAIEPFCGRLKPAQLKRLFGKHADNINSCALIPMRRGRLHGLIALGSNDEHRFNPGMDTLYLKRLGETIAATLQRMID